MTSKKSKVYLLTSTSGTITLQNTFSQENILLLSF